MIVRQSFQLSTPSGRINVKVTRAAKSVILRRRASGFVATAPHGISLCELREIILRLIARMPDTTEPAPHYTEGWQFPILDKIVEIRRQSIAPGKITISHRHDSTDILGIGTAIPLKSPDTTAAINSIILRRAASEITSRFIPRADEFARSLGIKPSAWKTGHGIRTLGTCSASGVITISAITALLPPELRRYILLHELAHLSHMNHSAAFYNELDRLLRLSHSDLDSRRLRAMLKQFNWSIIR